jgi:hypothetical protein
VNKHDKILKVSNYLSIKRLKAAQRFSLLVFAPVLGGFLLPALFLLPSGMLVILISIFDPTISIAQSAGYNAWGCFPILAAGGFVLIGVRLYAFFRRYRKPALISIWATFTCALFLAVWFGATILTSLGASDYPTEVFIKSTVGLAGFVTLIFQPGVWLWLYVSLRLLRYFESATT